MTRKQIHQRNIKNEIIGRFMGFCTSSSHINDFPEGKLLRHYFKKMKYHSDWNLLIRACHAFHSINLKKLKAKDQRKWQLHEIEISEAVGCYDIKYAHEELVTGIEWYNSIKK